GLVLGIGALIVLYAHYYLAEEDSASRFFGYLMLFMGAMLGVVLAHNLLLLVVFWELTSISSFLLIGFWTGRQDARQGARMALSITGMGGLALLGGVLLIGRVTGSYELDVVLASGDAIRASTLYPAILALVLAGVFTKSAQFPVHFWLPQAMAAPTPVSAYLHSATMVKAGVFLLARLHPALAGTDLFFYVVTSVGAITLLVGAWYAIFQHDLKGLLAYSTISHLGLITLLFGLSTPMAVVAGVFHIINHATFKASLFMSAGIIDHECGTRDLRRLGNLRRYLPWTSALAIVASLAMAGIPLLNGFLSKEMFFAQALEIQGHDLVRNFVSIAALLFAIFGVAYSLRFVHDTFFGPWPRAVAIVASLAMAGIPLLNGFLSREMFFAQAREIQGHDLVRNCVSIAALLFAIFGVAYSLRFVHDTFFGPGPREVDREVHEPPAFMQVPVATLVVLCVAVGIAPQLVVGPALQAASLGVLGPATPDYSLSVWHGFNLPLMMSIAGVVGGVILYSGLRRLFDLHAI